MNMDIGAMAREVKAAKDPREQINILADLNLCAPREIAEALEAAGALEGTGLRPRQFSSDYKPVPPSKSKETPGSKSWKKYAKTFDEKKARKLFDKGLSDEAIADQLHVAVRRIAEWRRASGLKREKGFNQISEKRRAEMIKKNQEERCEPCEPTQPECGACADDAQAEPASENRIRMEPREPVEPMSARGLETVLHRLLSQVLMDAPLAINGKPLLGVARMGVTVVNNQPYVDLTLEGGAL